ncbi:MAG TPA: UdgX family uracil-DNA binding protein [Gemmatimonadales bacterium]|nr:UdgX family uracil-DNA binding protein [Gemmatimonadales bacterium]
MFAMSQPCPPAPAVTGSAADFIPSRPTLPKLREAARCCRGCHLWMNATQTVFGEGASPADVMFVGEAPGDLEDRAGHPFVGPAGKLLDRAMLEAGLDRKRAYLTNSVKHFKFVVIERGRRLHKKPNAAEVRACNPWLGEEIRLVKPRVVVALGATAAQELLGKQFRVTQQRGKPMPTDVAEAIIATVHPSAVLRAPDAERERARREFVADLKRVATYLRRPKAKVAGSR